MTDQKRTPPGQQNMVRTAPEPIMRSWFYPETGENIEAATKADADRIRAERAKLSSNPLTNGQ